MTTAGMILSIHFTPANLTIMAITTYTRPANTPPIIRPRYPSCIDHAPPNAAIIEPIKANELPRKTGLFDFVNSRYTMVPAPAPNSAAVVLMPLPTVMGTAIVAAMMASSCWSAKTNVLPQPGLSFTS